MKRVYAIAIVVVLGAGAIAWAVFTHRTPSVSTEPPTHYAGSVSTPLPASQQWPHADPSAVPGAPATQQYQQQENAGISTPVTDW